MYSVLGSNKDQEENTKQRKIQTLSFYLSLKVKKLFKNEDREKYNKKKNPEIEFPIDNTFFKSTSMSCAIYMQCWGTFILKLYSSFPETTI